MLEPAAHAPKQVRTLFLSDIHLGMKGCQADKLLEFLRVYDADTIYLVGDIVDGWQLKSAWYWPQSHNDVVPKLLRQGRTHAANEPIPSGLVPCAHIYPAHMAREHNDEVHVQ